jgi:hypothetical protein
MRFLPAFLLLSDPVDVIPPGLSYEQRSWQIHVFPAAFAFLPQTERALIAQCGTRQTALPA